MLGGNFDAIQEETLQDEYLQLEQQLNGLNLPDAPLSLPDAPQRPIEVAQTGGAASGVARRFPFETFACQLQVV